MKKLLTAGVALLSVATLAACSGKTASESSSKDAKASSSKVEKSSTSESKSSSSSKSSKSATSSVKIPEIVLLTDDEIDNAKTIGDMKSLYSKLVDNYKKKCTRYRPTNSRSTESYLYKTSRASSQDTGRIKNSI